MIEVTDVRLKKVESTNRVKAVVSITINDCFVINDIKIVESQKGLFMMMPSRRGTDGTFKDLAHPITTEARERIQKAILKKYEEE